VEGIGTEAIPDLMRRNLLEVFGQRDPVARRAAIEELYDPAVRFADPEGSGVGHDAIDAAAEAVLTRFPDFHFTLAAPPTAVGDLGRLPWEMRAPDDTVSARGMDVAQIADARITRFWVFVEQP
jgi:SnoaL-like domain